MCFASFSCPLLFGHRHCPVTCCLDPFFHLHKFFHLWTPFLLWDSRARLVISGRSRRVATYFLLLNCCHLLLDPFFHLHKFFHPHLSLSILQARPVIVAGPAYLLPLPSPHLSLSLLQARLVIVAGPAYFLFSLSYRPGLSLWQVPPIPSFDLLYISPSLPLL